MGAKSDHPFGPQIAIYRSRRPGWRTLLALYMPGGAAVLAPLGYGLYRADYAYTHFGPAAALTWSRPYYLFSTAALILLIFLSLSIVRASQRYVAVHKGGLRLALSRRRDLAWDQIAGVSMDFRKELFLGIPVREHCRAVVYPKRGKPIRLESSLEKLPELVTRLKAGTYPRLLPRLRADLTSGQWISFGPLAIHLEGMRIRNRRALWADIRQVSVRSGSLVVEFEHRSPARLPVLIIPNLELLIQLIQTNITA